MPYVCSSPRTRVRTYRVVVVGLIGDQFRILERLIGEHPITVRKVSPEKLLRVGRLNGLVILTKFLKHKHSKHAERIAPKRVLRVGRGTASAVAAAIVAFFNRDKR